MNRISKNLGFYLLNLTNIYRLFQVLDIQVNAKRKVYNLIVEARQTHKDSKTDCKMRHYEINYQNSTYIKIFKIVVMYSKGTI